MQHMIKNKIRTFLARKGSTEDTPFALGDHMTARLRRLRRPFFEGWGWEVWLDIEVDAQMPLFPCQTKPVSTAPVQPDLFEKKGEVFKTLVRTTKVFGDQGAFWAQMDHPTRKWFAHSSVEIGGRIMKVKIFDSHGNQWRRIMDLPAQLEQSVQRAKGFAENLLKPDPAEDLAVLLAREPHAGVRRKALASWLKYRDPRDQPPPNSDHLDHTNSLEYWLLVLDSGGNLPAMVKAKLFESKDKHLPDLVLSVLSRMPKTRRLTFGMEALASPALAAKVAAHLTGIDDHRLATGLIAAHRRHADIHLFHYMHKIYAPSLVSYMLEIIANGSKSLVLEAARYVGNHGYEETLAPLINGRKRAPLGTRASYDQAVDRLRLRLGVSGEHAGAVSLVERDPLQGALDLPDASEGALSPASTQAHLPTKKPAHEELPHGN
ncbi:hypothetical protein [Acanthopleuribacter pedis]|uniref:Uncharacterized protein n=1 Tax=Acanthopleuribacter pedis TaxID=442870 RepID=A0A8J7QA86_9BACT|nr:hypothetical protein [Acanthopleuribacter pedis]MBO1320697.1 hypothetical protein [Acanthopleuribacter pedis]